MRKDIVFIIILIVFSITLVFYKYLEIPANLSFDEVAFARLATSLYHQTYTPYSFEATGHTTLYFYILALSLKFFGTTIQALRLPAAIFGVINPIIFFLLFKKIGKSHLIAFFAALVFITTRWHYNFARFSFEATFLIFLELTSLLLLFYYDKKKKKKFIFLSALFAGLAFHSYHPGKLFFIIPLLYLFIKNNRKLIVPYLLIFIVVSSPVLIYLSTRPDVRLADLSIVAEQSLSPAEKISQVATNFVKNITMLAFQGDMNGRHNFPGKGALNPILLISFIIGLGHAFIQRNREDITFIIFFILSIVPTIFTPPVDNPNMLRSVTLLIPIIYFVFRGVEFAEKKIAIRWIFVTLIILLINIHAFFDARTYFLFQSRVFRNAFEITCPLEKVIIYKTEQIPDLCRVQKNLF